MSFDCSTCKDSIKKLRRCKEDREDFTEDDGSLWPMYVTKGSGLYSFCPGKATWERSVMQTFNTLLIAAEMGSQYTDGGIENQPEWWIELCSWFIPRYNDAKFYSRARAILGDGTKPKGK